MSNVGTVESTPRYAAGECINELPGSSLPLIAPDCGDTGGRREGEGDPEMEAVEELQPRQAEAILHRSLARALTRRLLRTQVGVRRRE